MNPNKEFRTVLEQTKILKNPKHRLATFGNTKIKYFFLSEVKGFKDRSRIRQGIVVAETPQIITPEIYKNRFEGFGKKSKDFGNWLSEKYGDAFHGLEYKFRNEGKSIRLEHTPLKELAEKIEKRLKTEEFERCTIIQGPDRTWQISLMKFVVDECIASFSENIKELDEHGYFDSPDKTLKDRKREIEQLFLKVRKDRSLVPLLGKRLHQYGLFKEYEDRFFKLVKS